MRLTSFPLIAIAALALASARAQNPNLPPGAPLLAESALPEYERNIDHAGMIRALNRTSQQRGERIYRMVCHSCHGDTNLRGSLPEALHFVSGTFQNGNDPYAMYQTLTRGWRLMAPQVQLVPQEKYDVIHYIRQVFLAKQNPRQLFDVNDAYLAGLPKGNSTGPAPSPREPWREMDYGDFLIGTFQLADEANRALAAAAKEDAMFDRVRPGENIAYKGIAIRLDRGAGGVSAGKAWVVFEHDTLRLAGGWTGDGFIDWEGINFNSRHVVRPRTIGDIHFQLADGPGWANPATGKFDDARVVGADGRRFGPLPRDWMRYRGLYHDGERIVVSYTVGDAAILESHDLETTAGRPVFVRTLNVGKSSRDLILRVADAGTDVVVSPARAGPVATEEGFITLRIPAASTPLRLALGLGRQGSIRSDTPTSPAPPRDLSGSTRGGPTRWAEALAAPIVRSGRDGAFAWDRFTLPTANPWRSRMRTSGIDFLPGGKSAIVCCWDGDVWRVDGIAEDGTAATWRRIASGLFQPLGVKVRGSEIFLTCRDQLVALRDLNGDGEADFYESINSDHQVTEHFHEFAMGLQTDKAGNFYYAKSARHARTALVPQHGTLLRISADGSRTDILANGFRAANGVCLNPDGSFFVTDQEGHWMPMNRINRVTPGRFYGNMWSYGAPGDESDAAMEPPLCWIPKGFDRSPAELVRVESKTWGRLEGALLNLSYGRGRVEIVTLDSSSPVAQGAICVLPMPDFPTGIMRGRFHPQNGDLYVCGLSAWATSQTQQEGGFYRLRPTGQPAFVPVGWKVTPTGVEISFSELGDAAVAADAARYTVKTWTVKRTANYGGPHTDERTLAVTHADVVGERTVRLTIPALQPTWGIEIHCRLKDANGNEISRVLTGTIHAVPTAGEGPSKVTGTR